VIRLSVAGLLAVAFLTAPIAGADPQDLEPYCTGGQEPTTGECQAPPGDVYIDDAPGPDPHVPVGLDPETVPAV
jgi:hypothetical protein